MPFHIITGTSAPSVAPSFIGQHYVDTANKTLYEAAGTDTEYDWRRIDEGAFPPSLASSPDLPASLPGSDNLGVPFPKNFQWFRFVAPTPVGNNIRLIFGGLGTELWSAAFYDEDKTLVGSAERQAGNTSTFLTESDGSFTDGQTYYVLIINHDQDIAATGTVYYTHVA